MSLVSDLGGMFSKLYKRLPFSGRERRKKKRKGAGLEGVPKVGFLGSTKEPTNGPTRIDALSSGVDKYLPQNINKVADYFPTQKQISPDNTLAGQSTPSTFATLPSIPSIEEESTVDRFANYTDINVSDMSNRLKQTQALFYATYGMVPPDSLPLTIATNPNIKVGALANMFDNHPETVKEVKDLYSLQLGSETYGGETAYSPMQKETDAYKAGAFAARVGKNLVSWVARQGLETAKNVAAIPEAAALAWLPAQDEPSVEDLPDSWTPGRLPTEKEMEIARQKAAKRPHTILVSTPAGVIETSKTQEEISGRAVMGLVEVAAIAFGGAIGASRLGKIAIKGAEAAQVGNTINEVREKGLVKTLEENPGELLLSAFIINTEGKVVTNKIKEFIASPLMQDKIIPLTATAITDESGGFAPFGKNPRALAKIERRLLERNILDEPLADMPTFETRNAKVARQAADTYFNKVIIEDREKALLQLSGAITPPEEMFGEELLKAGERYVIKSGDIEVARILGTSNIGLEASVKGQQIQSLDDPELRDLSISNILKTIAEGKERLAKRRRQIPWGTSVKREAGRIKVDMEMAAKEAKVSAEEVTGEALKKLAKVSGKTSEGRLAKKVIKQLTPDEIKNLTPEQIEKKKTKELIDELFKIAKPTLSEKAKQKPEPIINRIRSLFAQDSEADRVYEAAKKTVHKKFANNPKVLTALKEYEGSRGKPPVAGVTVTKAVREELKNQGLKLQQVVQKSLKEQENVAAKVRENLTAEGFSPDAAKVFGELVDKEMKTQLNLARASVLKRMGQTKKNLSLTVEEKLARLNNLGALKNSDYYDLSRKSLNLDVPDEDIGQILDGARTVLKAKDLINDKTLKELPIGAPERMDYGRAVVALKKNITGAINPREKMGFMETIKDIKLKEFTNIPSVIGDIAGLTKAVKATGDNSFTLRQGLKVMYAEPKIWFKNMIKSHKDLVDSFGGKEVVDEVVADVVSRPRALNGQYDKLGLPIGILEEDLPTIFQEKLPLIGRVFKAADAAYTAAFNRNRADIADKWLDIAEKTGEPMDAEWYTGVGRVINSIVSRGYLGKSGEKIAGPLNKAFFSPRNAKANVDFLTAHIFDPEVRSIPFARKRAAKNLLRMIAGTAAILGTAKALGAKVEEDPRSADFGTIRTGNTRFDVTGGYKSIVVNAFRLLAWLATYKDEDIPFFKSSTTGEYKTREEYRGSTTGFDSVENFAINKTAPVGGLIFDILRGRDFKGDKITVKGEVKSLFLPMIYETSQDMRLPGSADTMLALIAEAEGISVQNYISPDNPLIKDDKDWHEVIDEKDKNGDFVMTAKEKFDLRAAWREEASMPYIDMLTKQKDKKAARGWKEFKKQMEERNRELEEEGVSPDSKDFNRDVWDEEVMGIGLKYPIFYTQYQRLPEKLLLR